jgi:regulator of sigma E protease
MDLLAIAFVFSFLVFFHELGHFLAAKLMGVRVERFSIGFPPRIFGKKIGDTDYCISAIPFGGYVKMSGMIDESLDKKTTGAEYEFNSKPVWKRVVIITAGVVMNFIIAIVIMTSLNYSKGKSILPYTQIGAIGKGGVAEKVGFQVKDQILAINGIEVHTWNDVNREFINNLNKNIRFDIDREGQSVILEYKKEWFAEEKGEILDLAPLPSSKIGEVVSGMPAAKSGMQTGDKIIEIAGKSVSNWIDLTKEIRQYSDDSVNIKWERNGEIHSAVMSPVPSTETDSSGTMITVGKIGVGYYYEHTPISFSEAIVSGFNGTIDMIALNIRALGWILTGVKPAKDVIGGPIMIAKLAGEAADSGWGNYWAFIAYLSAILAFFNILPIPALDGGHLIILLIEGIRRKPLSVNTVIKIQQIGMAILLTFIVLVLYVDISRIFF